MRRGTRVGQAYIALTADGSGINDDIADSMDDVDFGAIGDEHGKEYEDRLRARFDGISEEFDTFLRDLGKAIDTDNALTDGIRNKVNDAFTGGDLDALTQNIGKRLGISLGNELNTEVEKAVRNSVNDSLQKLGRDSNFDLSGFLRSISNGDEGAVTIIGPVQDKAEAAARSSMERQAREFVAIQSEALRDNAAHDRASIVERTRLYASLFDDIEARERQSAAIYQNILNGESAAAARSLADRAQAEEDDARRRTRAQVQYQQEFARLLEERDAAQARKAEADAQAEEVRQRQRDNDKFNQFDTAARSMLAGIKFDPRIDQTKINQTLRTLRANLEKESDLLTLELSGDLPLRERDRLRAEIEAIRAKIKVGVDEDYLNASLLSAKERAGSKGGSDDDGSGIASKIGSLLGAGSRNNFLNLIGKSVGNAAGLITKAQSAASSLFSTFKTGFSEAESGFLGLGKAAGGFGAVASKAGAALAASGPAIAIGLGVAVIAASVLVSVMSALLALAVALTATIATALTGALIVGAGALGAAAVAGGLLVAAFTSLTETQKTALAADFQPLKAQITGLGQAVLEDLLPYMSQIAPVLGNALNLLTPLASTIGTAFGQAGLSIASALSGPGFQLLSTTLAVYLPSIITNLGSAFGSLLDGLAGTFSAILPYVQQFSQYLSDLAARFDTFASSAEGQNSIADFMDRAIVSVKSLFGFLRELSGLIFDVLFSADAQNAGNSLFDSLADSFAGFRKKIEKFIADGSFKKWFDDAIKFGGDLKDAIVSIKDAFVALNDSGVLAATGEAIKDLAGLLSGLAAGLQKTKDAIDYLIGTELPGNGEVFISPDGKIPTPAGSGGLFSDNYQVPQGAQDKYDQITGKIKPAGPTIEESKAYADQQKAAAAIIKSGNDALADTYKSNGGTLADPEKTKNLVKKYVNPYVKFAEKLIKDGPALSATIRNAVIKFNEAFNKAIDSASTATSSKAARDALNGTIDSLRADAKTGVNNAQQALNSAASTLASAASPQAAKKALREVEQAQKDLIAAQANQKKVNAANKILAVQRTVTEGSVQNILAGIKSPYYSLAEYAEARDRLAVKIEAANKKLLEAIALRDNYNQTVVSSVQAFGSLVSAQAKTINGVAQALTADDVTSNLRAKLDQITKFKDDLRKLLALGLSNAAYKQIVDAGVEAGGAVANALVEGGVTAVQTTNGLVEQIDGLATGLGETASTRLYQAGVDAAQGLVDGLTSLSAELDSAAAALGNSIAAAVKRALGIASPSKVMKGITRNVGQTLIDGLGAEESGVDIAAGQLLSKVSVSPEVAKYTQEQADRAASVGVSENPVGPARENHWHIETPTEDPKAVANEAINELAARFN